MTGQDPIAAVIQRMQDRLDTLPARLAHHRVFLSTYQRTTRAVGEAVADGRFEDPGWVEQWDVVFADLYLEALDAELSPGQSPARPWRLAFGASSDLHPLRHLLLGINAHINFDLPQALLGVISDSELADPRLIGSRRRDHERIDSVLATRVSAEDQELGGPRSVLDQLLAPLNRAASRRILREARQKLWHNALELASARQAGPKLYGRRLAELELLSAAKVADLMTPGQVLLRLTIAGFGVTLPPL